MHYQPQIEAATERLAGLEALIRWRHPEQGLVMPDLFIPIAEDSGLIEPLGQWILCEVCRQLQDWQSSNHAALAGVRVAINISPLEFNRPRFVQHLRDTIIETGVPVQQLELEITESLLMQALPELSQRLREITAMGLSLTLDDFGTGYSSLGYLKRLPLRKIKIDRSFVSGIPGNTEDEAIIRATLSMAHDLGLAVVAEGVETPEQRDFLLAHRCDEFQGWLYGQPMPAEELPGWLAGLRRKSSVYGYSPAGSSAGGAIAPGGVPSG